MASSTKTPAGKPPASKTRAPKTPAAKAPASAPKKAPTKAPVAAPQQIAEPAKPAKPARPAKAAKAAKAAGAAAATKPPKQKLVRDSFTIPRTEYAVLDAVKQRLVTLARPAKKSELLRAGIKLLATLDDAALLAAMADVPAIKTGRPKADK